MTNINEFIYLYWFTKLWCITIFIVYTPIFFAKKCAIIPKV